MNDHLFCPKCRQFDVGDESCDMCGAPLRPILALGDASRPASMFDPLADVDEWDRRKALEEQWRATSGLGAGGSSGGVPHQPAPDHLTGEAA